MDRRKHISTGLLLALALLAPCAAWLGRDWWRQRQWFAIQRQQLAAIERLGEHPPAGWSAEAWQNVVVTAHNVWGNVTHHPATSGFTNREMRAFQLRLEVLASQTTSANSRGAVDEVYRFLQSQGRRTGLVTAYWDEYREQARAFDSEQGVRPAK